MAQGIKKAEQSSTKDPWLIFTYNKKEGRKEGKKEGRKERKKERKNERMKEPKEGRKYLGSSKERL